MMQAFNLYFPIAMFVFAAVLPRLCKVHPETSEDRLARARTLMRIGEVWMVCSIAGWVAWSLLASKPPVAPMMWAFFGVGLMLGIVAGNLRASGAAQGVRAASIAVRKPLRSVPSWALWVCHAIALVAILAVVARVGWPFEAPQDRVRWFVALGTAPLALLGSALIHWILVRVLPRSPRPLDPAGSAELIEAYERLERERAWSLYAIGFAMVVAQGALAVSLAWLTIGQTTGAALGIAGGVVGTLLGLAGGAIGIAQGRHQHRVELLRQRLTYEQVSPEVEAPRHAPA